MSDESFSPTNGVGVDSQQELVRLREIVKHLETERDEYKTALYRLLRARFKEEDVVLPEDTDCMTFDQFLPELEELVNRSQPGSAR